MVADDPSTAASSRVSTSRRSFFKKKNKNPDDLQSTMTTDTERKKRKSLGKRVKNFLRGKSRKSKRRPSEQSISVAGDAPAPSKAAAAATRSPEQYPPGGAATQEQRDMLRIPDEVLEDLHEEDEEDMYDENGGPKKSAAARSSALIQIVLLLIDPKTRHFELLQLEFDSPKAKVSDTLAQVPKSVTDRSIQKQHYQGVCNSSAKQYNPKSRLNDFVQGREVLVAIPDGVTVEDCLRLARPILSDAKVSKMLVSNDIDIDGWTSVSKSRSPVGATVDSTLTAPRGDATESSSGRRNVIIGAAVLLVLLLAAGGALVAMKGTEALDPIVAAVTSATQGTVSAVKATASSVATGAAAVRDRIPPLHTLVPKMMLKKPPPPPK